MQQQPDPIVTVPQSAIQALAQALQNHLNRSAQLHGALNIVNVSDQLMFSAWQTFDKACVPVEEKPADDTAKESQ
jgi:hypothetical protein